ncbi:2029_t:CDS:2 [Entrophospora sp. SA101]|nr:2029_t:CDS:2 [Entrophospora sp. SA101]
MKSTLRKKSAEKRVAENKKVVYDMLQFIDDKETYFQRQRKLYLSSIVEKFIRKIPKTLNGLEMKIQQQKDKIKYLTTKRKSLELERKEICVTTKNKKKQMGVNRYFNKKLEKLKNQISIEKYLFQLLKVQKKKELEKQKPSFDFELEESDIHF